jgi:hypothetical protein
MMSGVATFKCLVCKFSLTTAGFQIENGSRRTQAAKAMNEHVAAAHGPQPSTVRNWRFPAQPWPRELHKINHHPAPGLPSLSR